MKTALEFVQEVGRRKAALIHLKFSEDVTPQAMKEAFEKYRAFLAEQRKRVRETQELLAKEAQEASQRANALTQQLEKAGEGLPATLSAAVTAAPWGEVGWEARSIQDALREKQRLKGALQALEARQARVLQRLGELPALADEALARLEQEAAKPAETEDLSRQIQELTEKIKGISQDLGEQFEQEPHLFNELTKLVAIRARRKGIEGELRVLEQLQKAFEALAPAQEAVPAEEGDPDTAGQ